MLANACTKHRSTLRRVYRAALEIQTSRVAATNSNMADRLLTTYVLRRMPQFLPGITVVRRLVAVLLSVFAFRARFLPQFNKSVFEPLTSDLPTIRANTKFVISVRYRDAVQL
jgi:hypothetical protein